MNRVSLAVRWGARKVFRSGQKDDDDQEENSQVFFTVTSDRDVQRARDLGQVFVPDRVGSSVNKAEEIKADYLAKRRPDGLGFIWQRRWFVLTRSRLRYFRSPVDTRSHAQARRAAAQSPGCRPYQCA